MGYHVYLPPVPPGATQEDRRHMLEAYQALVREWNPWAFEADGTPKPAMPGWMILAILIGSCALATVPFVWLIIGSP